MRGHLRAAARFAVRGALPATASNVSHENRGDRSMVPSGPYPTSQLDVRLEGTGELHDRLLEERFAGRPIEALLERRAARNLKRVGVSSRRSRRPGLGHVFVPSRVVGEAGTHREL